MKAVLSISNEVPLALGLIQLHWFEQCCIIFMYTMTDLIVCLIFITRFGSGADWILVSLPSTKVQMENMLEVDQFNFKGTF